MCFEKPHGILKCQYLRNQWSFINDWKSKLKLFWYPIEFRVFQWPCKPWKWSKWPSKLVFQGNYVRKDTFVILLPSKFHSCSQITAFCTERICVDRNYVWQVCLPKCHPLTPYIFSKKCPWSHIFEAAPCIGRIISFKVQILENYGEKNLLNKISFNTDLFCAEWSYLAAWMEIWSK